MINPYGTKNEEYFDPIKTTNLRKRRENMAKEKTPKKNGSKKTDKPLLPMILGEIVKCDLVEYDTAGAPNLIYKKVSDLTIHGVCMHSSTDLTYLKKGIEQKSEFGDLHPIWVSLWKETLSTPQGTIDHVVVGHVAETLDDIIEDITDPKTNSTFSISFFYDMEEDVAA
jgi:hypothetical protein